MILISACGKEDEKATQQTIEENEKGETVRKVRVKISDNSDLSTWVSDPEHVPGKVTPLDAGNQPIKYADGNETGDLEFTTLYDFGDNNGYFQVQWNIIQFELPPEAVGFSLVFDNVPMRTCVPDPVTVELSQIYDLDADPATQNQELSSFEIEAGCTFALPGTASGLKGDITLVFNGEELVVSPDEEVNAEFSFGKPKYVYVQGDGSEDYLNANRDRVIKTIALEQTSAHVDDFAYSVTVKDSSVNCSVENGSGLLATIYGTNAKSSERPQGGHTPSMVQHYFVDPVKVTCHPETYSIAGNITDLDGTLVLQNNAGDDLTITTTAKGDKTFQFATTIEEGEDYDVTVLTHPEHQTCTVSNGSDTISENVTDVSITCAYNTYAIGGSVSGHLGDLTLAIGSTTVEVTGSESSYTFEGLTAKESYQVTVSVQPANQHCSVAEAGNITSHTGAVTNADITCVNTYTLGGNITGLDAPDKSLILDNLTSPLPTAQRRLTLNDTADGAWSFSYRVPHGEDFDVRIIGGTAMEDCTFDNEINAAGIATDNVTNIDISCAE